MTWLIHRKDRASIQNLAIAKSIDLDRDCIVIDYPTGKVSLKYENESEARQDFTYIKNSLKAGERLLYL